MTAPVDDALDAIWRAPSANRTTVAEQAAARLTDADFQMLRKWERSAAKARGGAGRAGSGSAGTGTSITVATLLVVAQYARDHLDSLMVALHESRQRDLALQAEQLGLSEDELWALLETASVVLGGRG